MEAFEWHSNAREDEKTNQDTKNDLPSREMNGVNVDGEIELFNRPKMDENTQNVYAFTVDVE
jgi:hypothetical protein